MKKFASGPMAALLLMGALFNSSNAQDHLKKSSNLWKQEQDVVYPQEVKAIVKTDEPVQGIALFDDTCYAVLKGTIFRLSGSGLVPVTGSPSGVNRILNEGNILWALTGSGIHRFINHKWQSIDNQLFVDLCMHQGILYGATSNEIYRLQNDRFVSVRPPEGYYSSDMTVVMEDGTQINADPVSPGPVTRIESYGGNLHILQPGRVVLFDGKTVNRDFVDWGRLPSEQTTDMLSAGSRMFISTSRGVGVLRGASLSTIKGINGLPFENTTCLAKGFDDDIWIGTTRGAIRMLKNSWHYFGEGNWLPGNVVNQIVAGDRIVYIATDKGIGIIRYEPFTLLKKAAFYEKHIEEWGHKRLGFIHSLYQKEGEWVREVSDNDGGHTATYLAAMCFKYAATHDKKAREEAVESFKAMLWLERISTVRGFFARSIWSATGDKDEKSRFGSGGLPAKWYPTPDGKWFWKGDTSSDEVTAHFYAVSLFYDLVAEGREKEMAGEHLRRIAGYIMDNGWVLKDLDGKPTRWGHWNPEYLLRPYGIVDRGLNSLEALTYMQTALSLTGDNKFRTGYQQLVDWGYPQNTVRQKNTFPPENIAPWDDDLAFESYNTLFRYTTDPILRSVYLRSLERTWEIKRMEHKPWYNFTYGVVTGNDCDLEISVNRLRETMLDCTSLNFRNSDRADLYPEPGYSSYEGGIRALSPRETSMEKGNRLSSELDGYGNGRVMVEPTGFLRDYWMGRYYGFIAAPSVADPVLTGVDQPKPGTKGAKPFSGSARPEF